MGQTRTSLNKSVTALYTGNEPGEVWSKCVALDENDDAFGLIPTARTCVMLACLEFSTEGVAHRKIGSHEVSFGVRIVR